MLNRVLTMSIIVLTLVVTVFILIVMIPLLMDLGGHYFCF